MVMRRRAGSREANNGHATGRRLAVPGFAVWCIALISVAFCTVFGFLVKEYLHLKSIAKEAKTLETQLADQHEILQFQRKQIQNFAGEINTLKDKLVSLSQFGQKVREMVDPDGDDDTDLVGVGGSAPADIEPSRDLKARHGDMMRRMHEQVEQLNQETEVQQEEFSSLIGALEEHQKLLARTPSIYPTKGIVTSTFGTRKSPFTGKSEFHKGLDIAAKSGSPVVAPADGRVVTAGNNGAYGKMVEIDHGYGVVTRYAHLKKFLKKEGARVKRGEAIASVGNTGRSTGPHLHYEIHLDGTPVDPQGYVMNSDDRQMASRKK